MSLDRLIAHLDRMQQAASEVGQFIQGIDRDTFLKDVEKQRAVGMNLMMIGEVATRIMEDYPEFAAEHPDLPWRAMRGMRDRIAHGYFDIDFTSAWETARKSLPELLSQLDSIRHWRAEGE
ncbi:DUF86 domain-containing protein [Rhizobium sp. BK602]|uniref:HepT-like ribonuclease domain-containing protein n=1 Tax=Rhizobium sp. BK602 TaxID=2586986 RepID=UPI001619C91C|nr:DUF86 domain-containing protein [Rhizobium sp. BK602]MBB3607132.1 uncharacterized protein with HEPN domain [Rhizobium sp. BK602]